MNASPAFIAVFFQGLSPSSTRVEVPAFLLSPPPLLLLFIVLFCFIIYIYMYVYLYIFPFSLFPVRLSWAILFKGGREGRPGMWTWDMHGWVRAGSGADEAGCVEMDVLLLRIRRI